MFMKKLLFIGLVSLSIFTACKTQIYAIGSSEAEFKAQNKGADVVEQTAHSTIYRRDRTAFRSGATTYYYFEDGKLVRTDLTGPNPNIIIQHTGN